LKKDLGIIKKEELLDFGRVYEIELNENKLSKKNIFVVLKIKRKKPQNQKPSKLKNNRLKMMHIVMSCVVCTTKIGQLMQHQITM